LATPALPHLLAGNVVFQLHPVFRLPLCHGNDSFRATWAYPVVMLQL
jgi:hypothetical protein